MSPDEIALVQLQALVGLPGALRIITNEVADESRDERDPLRFVAHDVVSIEGPTPAGTYVVRSAEGDWCEGKPAALLKRLREYNDAVAAQEA